jgi:IclR family KDG regulon transcriptional repressor
MPKDENTESAAKTLEHGLNVLTCFLDYNRELSLTEIAKIVQRNTSSTYRLILTLEQNGFLTKNPVNKKYFLGTTVKKLGELVDNNQDLILAVHPYLVKLHAEFNENVSLYVYHNFKRLCVDRIESTHALRQSVQIGEELPLTMGGGGTALLAWLPPKTRAAVMRSEPGTSEEALAKIREAGVAISRDELGHGTIGLGAPILDGEGVALASLNLSAPISRMPEEVIRKGAQALCQAAAEISASLNKT